ncbi:MAG: plasmid mobilization relaxosome protein MobC, partial [Mobilitalea sp.]
EQAKDLALKADLAGMCEADYLRFLISQKPNDYPEIRVLLKQLINEVNRIGNNINQVVHNNNSELYRREDKEHLIAYMKKLNLAVNEAVGQFGY